MNRQQRGQKLREIITQVREKEFPYEKRPKSKINWHDYDQAQCREIADTIDLIRDLVDSVETRSSDEFDQSKKVGRPATNQFDIVKVILLQSYLEIPNRVAEGLIFLFSEKLGLGPHFSYKTIERGYDKYRNDVNNILQFVFSLTNEPVKDLETVFAPDGTGFPTSMKKNYENDRAKQNQKQKAARIKNNSNTTDGSTEDDSWPENNNKKKHDYVHVVSLIGVKYKLYASWVPSCDHSVGETSLFPEAMEQTAANVTDVEKVLGDGLYATRPVCNTVAKYNAVPYFLPRRNVRLKRKGSDKWVDMLWQLVKDPQKWLSEYHMRSIAETGYSMIKRTTPVAIRKRLDPRKETESFLKAVVHNIRRLCYLTYLADIVPISDANAS